MRAEAALPGPDFDTLQVYITEIPPGTTIREVVVAGPQGERLSTRDFVTWTSESGKGVSGGPISLRLGYNAPVPRSGIQGGRPGLLSKRKRAWILLPAESTYLDAPQRWRVEVHYVDVVGDARVLRLDAPFPDLSDGEEEAE